jgi:hypothetical protein
MIKVNARIRLTKGDDGRKTPFVSGYKPLFSFISDMKTSGKIILKEQLDFFPGDEGIVEIVFLDRNYLGPNFGIGSTFIFGEGRGTLGDGTIIELLP